MATHSKKTMTAAEAARAIKRIHADAMAVLEDLKRKQLALLKSVVLKGEQSKMAKARATLSKKN